MTVTTVMSAAAFMGPVASAQTLPQIPEEELNAYPIYSGNDLELTVDAKGTHFALWSPGAEAVRLHLYVDGHNGNAYETVEMAKMRQQECGARLSRRSYMANFIRSK